MNKRNELLMDFFAYCLNHPEERFWQALRNWSGFGSILVRLVGDSEATRDTFYFKGKDQ